MEAMPYIDFLFGNETEAAAFAATESWPEKELSAIALRIAAFPKASGRRYGPSHAPSCEPLLALLGWYLDRWYLDRWHLDRLHGFRSGSAALHSALSGRELAHCTCLALLQIHTQAGSATSFQQPPSSLQSLSLPDGQVRDLSWPWVGLAIHHQQARHAAMLLERAGECCAGAARWSSRMAASPPPLCTTAR